MNTFISTLARDLSCAAAAVLISLIVSASFVHSTATVRGAQAAALSARSVSA